MNLISSKREIQAEELHKQVMALCKKSITFVQANTTLRTYKMKRHYLLIFLLLICVRLMAQLPEYGLHIQSYPLQNSEFTSMALEDGKYIETKGKSICLSFNLWVRPDNVFGTVFRIITDNNKNIDLMYSVSDNDKRFPILVTGDAVHPIQKEVRREIWTSANVTLDVKEGNITVSYDSTEIKVKYAELKGAKGIRIAFGYCPFEGFSLADVASINIKDISIKRGIKEIRQWKMARHNRDICYDEITHSPATGKNTRWIIDQYITWKKIHSQHFSSSPSVAFDPLVGTFYIANDKSKLYVFHTNERVTDTIRIKDGEFVANYPNQMIYIPHRRQLLSYNLNENLFSVFDPVTQSWKGTKAPVLDHDYWNNTLVYNPSDSSLISFGGYGHYHYNNKLIFSYPYEEKPQRLLNLTSIHPRYSCSSVIVDSTLYIFGGRGCPSGRQELSPRNYYDLYSVNLLTQQVNKIWEAPQAPVEGDFQPCENMIYDSEKGCFYFFCTQQGGTLMKINTQSPHFEVMSLPMELKLESQYLYSNLFYSPQQKKLYVVVHQAEVSGKANLDIFELNFPPIPISSFKQTDIATRQKSQNVASYLWLSIIGGLLIGIAIFYYKKKRKKSQPIKPFAKDEEKASVNTPSVEKTHALLSKEKSEAWRETSINVTEPTFHNYDFSKKCVCFFGGFRVIDEEGNDITALFTPTLKALLILLILYTGKDSKGIIGSKLIQLLWYDKTEESAKNNRNVYMSKLRGLLDKVGGIKILNQNGFWSIQFEEGAICDYLEAIQLYQGNNSQDLEKLLELLLRGMMLPNVETDWIDAFKNDFSNDTIDLLCKLLGQKDLSETLMLKIADTLFQHDYINEDALRVKCRLLCRQGKNGLAKTVYDTFCKEYTASLGADYKYSFMEIIGED